jgi:hypothetical protein
MRRRIAWLLAAAAVLAACTRGEEPPVVSGVRVTGPTAEAPTGAEPPESPEEEEPAGAPQPDEPIPADARSLATVLESTWQARREAVGAWLGSGGTRAWPPPEDVELLTLYEQRIYRTLAAEPRLAERVLDRLPRRVAIEARANVGAGEALYEHFQPLPELPDFRTRPPRPADALRRYFEAAERRFDVDWEVLAAVMLVETRMGRIISRSSAGAQGPMQFLPSTWAAYGLGGDVHDEREAVLGAANYLRASGAPKHTREALHHYNPVGAYVKAVSLYAKVMQHDPTAYYAYYNWQVFVRTTGGDVRLTGPGV